MRRSAMVTLTLLPLLAATARADSLTDNPPPMEPTTSDPTSNAPGAESQESQAPGMTAPTAAPATRFYVPSGELTCEEDPGQPACRPQSQPTHNYFSGIVRLGFGHYFSGGGG